MPRIPKASFNTQPDLSGSRISQSAALTDVRIAEQKGQTVSQLGKTIGNFAAQKKQADDSAYVTESINSISRTESELFNETSTQGGDIDLANGRKQFDERIKAALDSAPSSDAREILKQKADSLYNQKLFPMFAKYQSGKNVKARLNSFKSAQQDIEKDVLLGRTSFEEAAVRNEEVLEGMANTLGGVVDPQAERVASFSKLTTSYLSEEINKGNAQQVISEVKEGKWDEYADAKTLGRVVTEARRAITQQDNTNRSAYLSGAGDYLNFLKSGQDDLALAQKYSPAEVKKMVKGSKGAQLASDIEDARAFGQVMNDIKTATPDELGTIIQQAQPKSAQDFTRESKQANVVIRAAQQRNKAIQKDPAEYVNQNTRLGQFAYEELQNSLNDGDPELIKESITKYNSVQKAQQQSLGVNEGAVKLLPNNLADNYIARLNDTSEGGEGVANQVNFLKEMYGDDFNLVRNQLVSTGNLKSGVVVLSDMEAGQSQIQLAEAINIPQKEYKGILEDDVYKEITQNTKLEMKEFASTTNDPFYFNEHRKSIESLAMKLIADGVESDASDAINSAMDKVLNDRYEFVSDYRIPKTFNPTNVEAGVDGIIEDIKNGSIELLIPDSTLPPEDAVEVYRTKVVPRAHTTQDNKSIVFTHKNGDAILKADGEPLVIPFSELEKATPSFWQRLGF